MKKLLCLLFLTVMCVFVSGCGNKNVEGELTDIMDKLYEGVSDEEKPMMLTTTELNDETFESFAFVKDVNYKEAVVSESGVGSIPHSVVLIRLEDASESEEVVSLIKENANPRKWLCVEAQNVYVLSKGDLVVLIMSNELADTIKSNFENLK